MKPIVTHNGPHDGQQWDYTQPLPKTLVLLDNTLGYHEYRRDGTTTEYVYVGYLGQLGGLEGKH